jgi:hypothetical protein
LVALTHTGGVVAVLSLPAPGVRRVFFGTKGPVDGLAERLNANLSGITADGRAPEQVSVATPEGRRAIRTLAGVVTIAGVVHGLTALLMIWR